MYCFTFNNNCMKTAEKFFPNLIFQGTNKLMNFSQHNEMRLGKKKSVIEIGNKKIHANLKKSTMVLERIIYQ